MNQEALKRALAILDDLRTILPGHVAAIDALTRRLEDAASRHDAPRVPHASQPQ